MQQSLSMWGYTNIVISINKLSVVLPQLVCETHCGVPHPPMSSLSSPFQWIESHTELMSNHFHICQKVPLPVLCVEAVVEYQV